MFLDVAFCGDDAQKRTKRVADDDDDDDHNDDGLCSLLLPLTYRMAFSECLC